MIKYEIRCELNYYYKNVKTSQNIVKMSNVKKICLSVFFYIS